VYVCVCVCVCNTLCMCAYGLHGRIEQNIGTNFTKPSHQSHGDGGLGLYWFKMPRNQAARAGSKPGTGVLGDSA
jgi:hypothetical protein